MLVVTFTGGEWQIIQVCWEANSYRFLTCHRGSYNHWYTNKAKPIYTNKAKPIFLIIPPFPICFIPRMVLFPEGFQRAESIATYRFYKAV